MTKKTQSIELTDMVSVTLTGFGRHILDKHLDSAAARDFEEELDREQGQRPRHVRRPQRTMALWEAIHIFGPHIRSSMRWPISSFSFEREDEEVDEWKQKSRWSRDQLFDLAATVGLELEYSSPEETRRRIDDYDLGTPTFVPGHAGWWWLGDRVVLVEWVQGKAWCVKLGNGRRKPVEDYPAADWGGPAIRDPRVKKNGPGDPLF